MKLLRLTTTDPNAVFDTVLNTDLKITYNNGTGSQSANLSVATYSGTESDSLALFADMEKQLDKKLVVTGGKDFGGRFSVKAINGKNQIGYLISPYTFDNFNNPEGNIEITGNLGDPNRIVDQSGANTSNDSNRIMWNKPLVPGAGVFRTQVYMLEPVV